jgi:hypothetical protein
MYCRTACLITIAAALSLPAAGQGLASELLAGNLLKPRVGQWAWYDLHDTENDSQYAVREAVVGKERVGRETGYWLEIEIVPQVGYKTILKALLTGPASDADNIKRLIVKYGLNPVQDVEVDEEGMGEDPGRGRRESLGMEDVQTKSGVVRAERFRVTREDEVVDLWINGEVLPTGIVRLRSPKGEWILRSHGFGGEEGQTKLPHDTAEPSKENEVESGPAGEGDGN